MVTGSFECFGRNERAGDENKTFFSGSIRVGFHLLERLLPTAYTDTFDM